MAISLDDIPVEIFVEFLASTDSFHDLIGLASIPSRARLIFQDNKAGLVYDLLCRQLGPLLPDALALNDIPMPLSATPRSEYLTQARKVIATYQQYLAGQNLPMRVRQPMPWDGVLRLAKTYNVMKYATQLYIDSQMIQFKNEINPFSSTPCTIDALPQSRTEHLRILCAFYRLHLCINIHGESLEDERRTVNKPDALIIHYYLNRLWEPWEVMQVSCIVDFLYRLHHQMQDIWPVDQAMCLRGMSRTVVYCLSGLHDFIEKDLKLKNEDLWRRVLWGASSIGKWPKDESALETLGYAFIYYPTYHDYRMKTQPMENRDFPVSLVFEGDDVSRTPFAWADAFDGLYDHDFFSGTAFGESLEWRLASLDLPDARPDSHYFDGPIARRVWGRLGFMVWDKEQVLAMKASTALEGLETGWARRRTARGTG